MLHEHNILHSYHFNPDNDHSMLQVTHYYHITTQCHDPEDHNMNHNCCQRLKTYTGKYEF